LTAETAGGGVKRQVTKTIQHSTWKNMSQPSCPTWNYPPSPATSPASK